MERIFYHGYFYCTIENLDKMFNIITSGGIKSQKRLGLCSRGGYNGDEYICVCSKEETFYYDYLMNAYNAYVLNSFCFIIDDDIQAIKTMLVEPGGANGINWAFDQMRICPSKRYSDLCDEWQVKDEISLNHIMGIGIPFDDISTFMNICDFKERVNKLIECAKLLKWDIVNTSNAKNLEEYEKCMIDSKKVNSLGNV